MFPLLARVQHLFSLTHSLTQVTGQSTEVLLLGGFLQVLHTAVWNILTAIIKW